ncbi:unnamed protein product, partial [Musa hybrid cultivar]
PTRAARPRASAPRPHPPGPLGPTRTVEPPASAPRTRTARPRRQSAREQPARVGTMRANSPPTSAPHARTARPRRRPAHEQPAQLAASAPQHRAQPTLPRPLGRTRAASPTASLSRPGAWSASSIPVGVSCAPGLVRLCVPRRPLHACRTELQRSFLPRPHARPTGQRRSHAHDPSVACARSARPRRHPARDQPAQLAASAPCAANTLPRP